VTVFQNISGLTVSFKIDGDEFEQTFKNKAGGGK